MDPCCIPGQRGQDNEIEAKIAKQKNKAYLLRTGGTVAPGLLAVGVLEEGSLLKFCLKFCNQHYQSDINLEKTPYGFAAIFYNVIPLLDVAG